MGANSELFLGLRESQLYAQDFTKKQAIETGKRMVDNLIESGEINLMEFGANLVRLHQVVDTALSELKQHLPEDSAFGIEVKRRNVGETLNYSEDHIYAELQEKLKQRAELIKVATKSNDPIYDSEGVEVTKVSTTPRKDSLVITF